MRLPFLIVMFSAVVANSPAPAATGTVTWLGWFSDKQCAEAKVKAEEVTPNGTECVKS